MGYLIGYDIGSSFVKVTLLDINSGKAVTTQQAPESEMQISSPVPGWAEQNPEDWWKNAVAATNIIKNLFKKELTGVAAIGISYQMHGLVTVDSSRKTVRPAIIWCDGRAVPYGKMATDALGSEFCLSHYLNFPGNFTASKLAWVRNNEFENYSRTHKIMLPGDYIAMRMTGEISTSQSGLSEGILWDFSDSTIARSLLEHYHISDSMIPQYHSSFAVHGTLQTEAATELGLPPGIPVSYRAGDQPNNALSLNVLNPGEIAVTAGTSGVVYGISDKATFDKMSRVNTFIHVNHTECSPRYGVLLCVNGTGIANSWLRKCIIGLDGQELSYNKMNAMASEVPEGSDGLMFVPFGNGAERILENEDICASLYGLRFTRHDQRYLARACQEGIAFAFNYGIEIMKSMGMNISRCRAGFANMFQSDIFADVFSSVTGTEIELYNTDGSQGAARGAGIGAKIYTFANAFDGLEPLRKVVPHPLKTIKYKEIYDRWQQLVKNNF